MDLHSAQIHLVFGWIRIGFGIVFGALLGSRFHEDRWWNGYMSFKRRLYRLAHVAIFALAMINLLFHFTVRGLQAPSIATPIASIGFLVGASMMPVCCITVARAPKLRMLFALPISSLLLASALTAWEAIVR